MTDAVSIKDIQAQQDVLQKAYDAATIVFNDARAKHQEVKGELMVFNNKYGRVLQLMKED